ncbi:DUF3667 domain-containing protein [Mangrovimonas aestuarii]|uniref:DUF3667 domain-containing protein n=1 Tax=Mangrovimonas aestuarii TaxID=3018443 RepID=UPI002377FE8B|nr:DUF3667 domain-containing protein [Mangrovimonas aestuarii]
MNNQKINCKNCENLIDSSYKFCPNCGQKNKEDLTLGVLFYNTIHNYFSIDARFFKSFIPLMTKPGYVAKQFVQGKRMLYLHPAQFYLFVSVVFFFLFSFKVRDQRMAVDEVLKRTTVFDSIHGSINMDSLDNKGNVRFTVNQKDNELIGLDLSDLDSLGVHGDTVQKDNIDFGFDQSKVDSLIAINADEKEIFKAMGMTEGAGAFQRKLFSQMLKFYKQRSGGAILQAFYDSIPIALFVLLPIFALILKLLFYRKGRFAYHLVFSFYYFAFLFTVFSVLLLVNFVWDIPGWLEWIIILSVFAYLFFAIKKFYGQGYIVCFIKSGVATFLFLMIVLPLAATIVGLAAFMMY